MRVAVVGATGHTGSLVVEQALARGHQVTALARRPEDIVRRHPNLVSVAADVLDAEGLASALAGNEAVVSALGIGASRRATIVYSEGIKNVLGAMGAHGISRIAVISAAPAGVRAEQPLLERHVLMPLLERLFGATYEDMRRMEALLRASNVDWVSLRPPRLVNKPATGRYRVDAAGPLRKARSISFPDLATALLDSLDREDLYRRAAYIAN